MTSTLMYNAGRLPPSSNGAGKTTVFNCLTGFYRASGGNILFNTRSKTTNVIQVLGQKFQPGDWINPPRLGSRLFYKMFGGTHRKPRGSCAHVPEYPPVSRDVGRRKPAGCTAYACKSQSPRRCAQHPPGVGRKVMPSIVHFTGWKWWTWWTAPIASGKCLTVNSDASKSPGQCVRVRR